MKKAAGNGFFLLKVGSFDIRFVLFFALSFSLSAFSNLIVFLQKQNKISI